MEYLFYKQAKNRGACFCFGMGKRVNGVGERTDLRTSQQMYHRQKTESRNSFQKFKIVWWGASIFPYLELQTTVF